MSSSIAHQQQQYHHRQEQLARQQQHQQKQFNNATSPSEVLPADPAQVDQIFPRCQPKSPTTEELISIEANPPPTAEKKTKKKVKKVIVKKKKKKVVGAKDGEVRAINHNMK